MSNETISISKRIGRALFVIIIEELIRYFSGSALSILCVPALMGLGKYLRAKHDYTNIPF